MQFEFFDRLGFERAQKIAGIDQTIETLIQGIATGLQIQRCGDGGSGTHLSGGCCALLA